MTESKKVLLIGGGGFVGRRLQEKLAACGHCPVSADLPALAEQNPAFLPVDLNNQDSLIRVLKQCRPEVIVLLAAQSSVMKSWQEPENTLATNIGGAVQAFQCAAEIVPHARFVFVGSAEEYGKRDVPGASLTEDAVCHPLNPYAVSKFCAGNMLELLALKTSLELVHLRPVNHFGPRQRPDFVVADFCRRIAEIEAGRAEPVLTVGNLAAERDFLFVDDVIAAYLKVIESAVLPHSIYNIASGQVVSIQKVLDTLLSYSAVPIKVTVDPAKFRTIDYPAVRISAERLARDFNWQPDCTLNCGLKKTLEWWRQNIQH